MRIFRACAQGDVGIMRNLSNKLYPLTDEDIEMLWECLGLSVEELEDIKEDYEEQQKQKQNES